MRRSSSHSWWSILPIAMAVGSGTVYADPPGAGPTAASPTAASPAEASPAAQYPTSLAERPLTMPAGVFELSAQIDTSDYAGDSGIDWGDYVYSRLRLRAGAGPIELHAELDLQLDAPSEDFYGETVNRVGAGALLPIGANGAGYLDGEIYYPGSDYKSLGLHGGYAVRYQTAPNIAIGGRGGLRYSRSLPADNDSYSTLSAEAQLDAQVQLNPQWGADFLAGLDIPLADDYDFDAGLDTAAKIGARLVFTTARFDAFGGLGLATGYFSQRQVLIGVAGRLP